MLNLHVTGSKSESVATSVPVTVFYVEFSVFTEKNKNCEEAPGPTRNTFYTHFKFIFKQCESG